MRQNELLLLILCASPKLSDFQVWWCGWLHGSLENNPVIAIAGEWFTAHGKGINLGYFGKEENHRIAKRLKEVFSEWIDNGHTDFGDENTVILCVELTDGLLLSHGTRYEF